MLHVQPTFLDEVILMKQWTAKFPDEMNAIEACQKQVQSGQEQLQTGMIRGSEVQTRLNVKVAKEYFCMKKCVKEAESELTKQKAELDGLQKQLAGAKEDLNGLSSKLDTRDQELIQTKKDLNATISEVGDLKLVVSQQEMDIAQGKADIQRMESEREAEKERTDRSHDLDHETKPIVSLYKGRAVYNGHSFDVLTIELTG